MMSATSLTVRVDQRLDRDRRDVRGIDEGFRGQAKSWKVIGWNAPAWTLQAAK